ncbi:MAG: hypothetical protein KGR25_12085, partial [Chloroflexi bacterium]|nr:hypothetical protein [Chloroflexota bacterium]
MNGLPNSRAPHRVVVLAVALTALVAPTAHAAPDRTVGSFETYKPALFAGSAPWGIAAGPDGAMWFTQMQGNGIGRIAVDGRVAQFPIPTPSSNPFDIAAGPDGAMWFTEWAGNKIGRITMDGTITEITVPTPAAGPWGIATGPDGAMWFTEWTGNRIGRITMDGTITEYPVPTPNAIP